MTVPGARPRWSPFSLFVSARPRPRCSPSAATGLAGDARTLDVAFVPRDGNGAWVGHRRVAVGPGSAVVGLGSLRPRPAPPWGPPVSLSVPTVFEPSFKEPHFALGKSKSDSTFILGLRDRLSCLLLADQSCVEGGRVGSLRCAALGRPWWVPGAVGGHGPGVSEPAGDRSLGGRPGLGLLHTCCPGSWGGQRDGVWSGCPPPPSSSAW